MFRLRNLLYVSLLLLLVSACAPVLAAPALPSTPTNVAPTTSVVVVQSVEIQILESWPIQIHIIIRGQLPDAGCTTISSANQVRDGNTFKLTLITTTDPLALCAQALTPFEQVVALDVNNSPAGRYIVNVHGIEQTFDLPSNVSTDVYPTDVQYVMAQSDLQIFSGPGSNFGVVGQVFGGQTVKVTGTNVDGSWWRVICSDSTIGSCWVSGDPALTQPTNSPDVNQPQPPSPSEVQPTSVQYIRRNRMSSSAMDRAHSSK
jgi:uncharacterized protein YgiM (DUF1202 family)